MSLTTPSIRDISDNIVAQLEAALGQSIPWLPKSFSRVLAKALAGVFILVYKYAGFMFLQQFVRTATMDETVINGQARRPLLEWGRQIGVSDPTAATNAQLVVEITVENQTGTLSANSQLVGPDNGVTYITLAAVTLDAATKQVTVRAVSDQTGGGGAGSIGNLDAGATLSFANPIANVARTAVVVSQSVTGADAEEVEAYRQRVLDRFQKRPQGGAYSDYEQWAEETPGVLNAYPYTSVSPGQVDVYIEATAASSGSADGIPTAAQLQAALDNIYYDSAGTARRRPANALPNTFPITRTGFDVAVPGLMVDDLAGVRTQIEDALDEYFRSREPFIPGLSVPPRKDRITNSAVAGVVEDIVSAVGGIFTGVVLSQSGVTLTVYTLGEGEKAKLKTVTWA